MALTRQFFNTPTGTTYQPGRDIERSFDKSSMLIGNMMQRESDRLKQEEAAFGELYNNIGELESTLMSNYAGIEQQAIQSTRDFIKQHLKNKGRINDPEFQVALGERTGRIKAAMSNAERNREMLKSAADTIKNDSSIIDKATAMTSLMSKMNDPDFLISKNPFDVESFLDGFVNPQKVFEGVVKNLPTTGEFGDEFFDQQGNLKSRTILTNPLIDQSSPFTEDGKPNIQITDEFANDVAQGVYGKRVLQKVQQIASDRYSDMPNDVAFRAALKDGMGSAMGVNYKESVKKSASDLKREQNQLARQNRETDLRYKRELRLSKQEDDTQDTLDRWDKFANAVMTGNEGFLGDYAKPSGNVDEVTVQTRANNPNYQAVSTKEKWDSLDRDDRIKIIEQLGVSEKVPRGTLGRWDTQNPETYKAVMDAMNEIIPEKSIEYRQKVPKNVSESGFITNQIPINEPSDIEKAFRMFEQLRGTKQKETKVGQLPSSTGNNSKDLTSIWDE